MKIIYRFLKRILPLFRPFYIPKIGREGKKKTYERINDIKNISMIADDKKKMDV